MREELPRLSLLLSWRADVAALNTLKECARQFAFAGVAFAVDGAQVKEFIAERVALFQLRKDGLHGNG
jgi:hypothetical protein